MNPRNALIRWRAWLPGGAAAGAVSPHGVRHPCRDSGCPDASGTLQHGRHAAARPARRFWPIGDRGVAALEAVIILPIMVFLVFGVVELYQYFRVAAIMDRATFAVADGIAMQPKLNDRGDCTVTTDICTYGLIMSDLMLPVDYKNGGTMDIRLFVSNFKSGDKSDPGTWSRTPAWGKHCLGTGACSAQNQIATLPAGMPPAVGQDTMLVVQVSQEYEPFVISARFWTGLGGKRELTTVAFYRPRFDDLKTLN